MNDELKKICKKLYGSVLSVGLDNDKVKEVIEDNDDILSSIYINKYKRRKFRQEIDNCYKKISIRRLKSVFKNKSINFMLCNYDILKSYKRHFIKNSINISIDGVFFYGKIEDVDLDELEYRYKRYGCKTEIVKGKNYFIMRIDTLKVKAPFMKNILYRIRDCFYDFIDVVGDLMAT